MALKALSRSPAAPPTPLRRHVQRRAVLSLSLALPLPQPRRCYSAPLDHAIPLSKQKYVPTSGTYPLGFLASGTHVGVKPTAANATKKPDVALVASETPCAAAAVFTRNRFQAAPVVVSREILERRGNDGIRAVVVNSGCANAVTGKGGLEDARRMCAEVDRCFARSSSSSWSSWSSSAFSAASAAASAASDAASTLVMSTGVIGQRLPLPRILAGIPAAHATLSATHASWLAAARAICTTDTFPKLLSRTFTLPSAPGTTYRIAGMTKGAGMIHPNMATLLGILCTDAPVSPAILPTLLAAAVDRSFNAISVDGDTSTNDTVALLANGAAGGPPIASPSSPGYAALRETLTAFAASLAQLVVRDGEGATKFVTVRVRHAATRADAKAVAGTIARSPLVKTALYGKDANWGRILCATGYADRVSTLDPARTSVSFRPTDGSPELRLLVAGEPEAVDEARAAQILEAEDLEIVVDLGVGAEEAVYWTCDFSHEYVTINGDYRT